MGMSIDWLSMNMTQQKNNTIQCPSSPEAKNTTPLPEFLLLGISENPKLQPILFELFLSMYLVTVFGNLLIILAVSCDSRLHTPMYFFLCNLSWADIGFISTTVPYMLVCMKIHSRVISYVDCLTQMSLFTTFGCMDALLLTVMAYDRFVAICHPLNYLVLMNPRLCVTLVLLSLMFSILETWLHLLVALQIADFKEVGISSTFCDPSLLLNLSCSDTIPDKIMKYLVSIVFGVLPVSGIFFSYYKIVSSILGMPSSGGRSKAFSTCGSHLSVVGLFYGSGIVVYIGSTVSHSSRNQSVSSLMYSVVTPVFNPFIYSLRNKDIKNALRKLLSRLF